MAFLKQNQGTRNLIPVLYMFPHQFFIPVLLKIHEMQLPVYGTFGL